MDLALAESEAAFLLGDYDPAAPPAARAIARRHLGSEAIVRIRGLVASPAELARDGERFCVVLREGLPAALERWFIFHELGEWRLKQLDYRDDDIELMAEAIAAACVLPRDSYRAALRLCGRRFRRIARVFATTETAAARRLGEVTGEPVAVVAPTHVHVSGDEYVWPAPPVLRDIAYAKRMPRGVPVKRVSLTDDRRRRVLLAG